MNLPRMIALARPTYDDCQYAMLKEETLLGVLQIGIVASINPVNSVVQDPRFRSSGQSNHCS